ncbi:unnamed protein product (macronuclear) [Paramecium tetraurelia]|uniref:Uncharacterized protein n=1 Tax=Paramecium tetraurelia TaxID=5888 RepID=A0BQX5_PARTE|nr:uncharacterized protein GSPATT00031171001 [Paramecium tetraurelia]CAK60942.1 unnamed protein product [Paramecium tetraurelia]|eukprot:XP_001428340.1 hypothetical protein (macronuclear) [Paramecium tetraurelia strain d4-2]
MEHQTRGKESVEEEMEFLSNQIKNMQIKQEQLESQHYQLSTNVKKINLEKKHQVQVRNRNVINQGKQLDDKKIGLHN